MQRKSSTIDMLPNSPHRHHLNNFVHLHLMRSSLVVNLIIELNQQNISRFCICPHIDTGNSIRIQPHSISQL